MATKSFLNKLLIPVSREELHSLYEKIIGATVPAEQTTSEKPLYLQAAESRAAALGISADQLLAEYSQRLVASSYPTPDCLTPDEVQAYSNGSNLSAEEQEHIASCESCRSLLEAARPSSEVLTPLMEEVRLLAVRATAGTSVKRTAVGQGSSTTAAKMFK